LISTHFKKACSSSFRLSASGLVLSLSFGSADDLLPGLLSALFSAWSGLASVSLFGWFDAFSFSGFASSSEARDSSAAASESRPR
jgi:hypothetical protein